MNKSKRILPKDICTDIIIEQSNKLNNIFDKLNIEVCSKCNMNKDNCEMGCCLHCAKENAHFSLHKYYSTYVCINRIKELFHFDEKRFGFFNNLTKKCNLPRELRSDICLRYTCKQFKLNKTQKYNIDKICEIIKLCKKAMMIPF